MVQESEYEFKGKEWDWELENLDQRRLKVNSYLWKMNIKFWLRKNNLITPLRGQYFPAPFRGLQRRPEQHSVFLQLLSLEQLATHFPQ